MESEFIQPALGVGTLPLEHEPFFAVSLSHGNICHTHPRSQQFENPLGRTHYHGSFMIPRAALAFALLSLCACQPAGENQSAGEGHMQAVIGAVLIDGQGGPPLSSSVVVIAGGRIRAAGASSVVPIPAEADK